MNAKDVINSSMDMCTHVLKQYFTDLSDAELLTRPGVGCNHLAWQLGHLIAGEAHLLNQVCPGAAAELPSGFAEAHGKENSTCDDPAKFYTKQQYIDLMDKVRASTKAALEKLPDADLDKPGPESMRSFFPTVGSFFNMIATHPMMHAGQFVPVRRALGKPVVM